MCADFGFQFGLRIRLGLCRWFDMSLKGRTSVLGASHLLQSINSFRQRRNQALQLFILFVGRHREIVRSARRNTSFAPSFRMILDLGEEAANTNMAGGPSDRRLSRWYSCGCSFVSRRRKCCLVTVTRIPSRQSGPIL